VLAEDSQTSNDQVGQYQLQKRGGHAEYERYLQAMDASMQQKVALTAAHLLSRGTLADMGMGSGTGSEALAALYPSIQVVGVDVNPEMVERAGKRYDRANLDFKVGDISLPVFPSESLDTIFNSSVLHHVTSFNGYRIPLIYTTIANQVEQLKTDGNLIIRDFLRPHSQQVVLELPNSTAPLFCKFARQFRFLRPERERGFPYRELDSQREGWSRFELDLVHATEFILRKDYTSDWDTEIQEEYTYFTQDEFEQCFRDNGLRILASTPLLNPWIVRNRFEGKFRLTDLDGEVLAYPPTNYLIVGEKVCEDDGVCFRAAAPQEPIGYLEIAHYEHRDSGALRDLVRRPNATLDVVPYFLEGDELYIVARKSYPRPLLSLCEDRLDGSLSPAYVTEPVVIVQGDKPVAQTAEEALSLRVGIVPERLLRFDFGSLTYPSPGGLQEQVQAVYVETEPILVSEVTEKARSVSARQLLRSAQVGGLPDARLEIHCFELLQRLGLPPGSWIGETIHLRSQAIYPAQQLSSVMTGSPRRAFRRSSRSAEFLALRHRKFLEMNSREKEVGVLALDYVEPAHLSLSTVAVAPLWKTQDEVFVGVADDDFPAAQCFSGHSNLLVAPAWRAPREVESLSQLKEFVKRRLLLQHALNTEELFTLGGPYFPSPGVTPEVVYPLACDVTLGQDPPEPLVWVPLSLLTEQFHALRDGHLKVVVSRVARAVGRTGGGEE